MWLDHNSFTGTVPEAWCIASVTSAVHVDHNPGLFGDVPYCLEGRLRQGRGLEGTGLALLSSTRSGEPDQASAGGSTSGSSDAAVFCNSATCGSVFFLLITFLYSIIQYSYAHGSSLYSLCNHRLQCDVCRQHIPSKPVCVQTCCLDMSSCSARSAGPCIASIPMQDGPLHSHPHGTE